MRLWHVLCLFLISTETVFAASGTFGVEVVIQKPDSSYLQDPSVDFKFTVTDDSGTCVIYSEEHLSVDMSGTNGQKTFQLGNTLLQTYPNPLVTTLTIDQVFSSSGVVYNCQGGGTYTSTTSASRKVIMEFNDGSGLQTLPAMAINSVPYAVEAQKVVNNSITTQNILDGTIAAADLSSMGAAAGQVMKWNGSAWVASNDNSGSGLVSSVAGRTGAVVLSSSDISGLGSLAGKNQIQLSTDVTGTLPLSNLAQSAATTGQVIKWNGSAWVVSDDSSGLADFSTLTSADITGKLGYTPVNPAAAVISVAGRTGVVTLSSSDISGISFGTTSGTFAQGNDSRLSDTRTPTDNTVTSVKILDGTIQSADISAGAITFDKLNQSAAVTGQVIKWNGSAWVVSDDNSGAGGSVTSVTASGPLSSSGGANPNITIAQANGTTSGYLSSADWTLFNAKLSDFSTLTSADITGKLGYTPLANYGSMTSTDVTTALSYVPLSPATLLSGDVSGSYNAITVDRIKNIPIALSSLTSGDIVQYNGSAFVNRNIPTCTANQYLTFDGSSYTCVTDVGASGTVGSINALTGALNVVTGVAGTNFNIDSTGTTITLNMPTASSVNRGLLSSADWSLFNAKLSDFSTLTSADITGKLGYTPVNPATAVISVAGRTGTVTLSSADISGLGTLAGKNQIQLSTDVTGTLPLANIAQSSATTGQVIKWNGSSWVASSDSGDIFNGGNTGTVTIGTNNATDLNFETNNSVRMTIDNNGNVGIGTSPNPSYTVDIANHVRAGTLNSSLISVGGYWSASQDQIESMVGLPLNFGTNTSGSPLTRMTILPTGRVGIGLTNPNYSLDVSGDVNVSGVFRVNGTPLGSGTVTSVTASSPLSSSGGATPNITIAQANGTTSGYLSSADWTTFNSKLSNFSSLTSTDITGKLGYTPLANFSSMISTDVTNALGYVPANIGSVILASQMPANCGVGQTLTFSSPTGSWLCSNIVLANDSVLSAMISSLDWSKVANRPSTLAGYGISMSSSDITTALTYTPVNRAGDTMTGALNLPSNGLAVGSNQLVVSGGNVGIGTASPNVAGWPDTTLTISGRNDAANAQGIIELVNNRTTAASADKTGTLNFVSRNNAGAEKRTALIQSVLSGSGGVNGFGGTLYFNTKQDNATTTNIAMTINDLGNVGIGTSSPSYKLDVAGDVNITGNFKVNGVNISAGGGTVTSVTSAGAPIVMGGTSADPTISITQANGTTSGYLSSADWTLFNAKLSDFSTLTSADITGKLGYTPLANYGSMTSTDVTTALGYTPVNPATAVISVAGRTGVVTLSSADISGISFGSTSGTFAEGNDSRLTDERTPINNSVTSAKIVDGTITSADISSGAITFDKLNQSSATTGQVIKWDGSAWIASSDSGLSSLTSTDITTALTYTPVNRAGDTMTGALNLPSNGLAVGTNELVVSSGQVGIGLTNPSYALDVSGDVNVTGVFRVNGSVVGSGTVTAVTASSPLSSSGGTSPNLTIARATASVDGYLASTDWTTFNSKLSDFSTLTSADITGKLGYTPLSPANNLSDVSNAATARTNLGLGAGNSPTLTGLTLSGVNGNTLVKTNGSGVFSNATSADVTSLLGYTPANGTSYVAKAGDTMTGTLNLPSNGLAVGTSQFVVNSGNVGIGTASPDSKLTISEGGFRIANDTATGTDIQIDNHFDSSEGPLILLRKTRGSKAAQTYPQVGDSLGSISFQNKDYVEGASIVASTTAAHNGSTANTALIFKTTSGTTPQTRMMIDEVGRVSIGIPSPSYSLDVSGDVNVTGNFRVNGSIVGASQWLTSGSHIYYNSGNVGIGTTSPAAPMDLRSEASAGVNKVLNLTGLISGLEQGPYISLNYSTSAGGASQGESRIGTVHDISGSQNSAIVFSTTRNANLSEKVRISADGFLGIGTNAPAYKVDVAGDVNVTGNFKVNGTNIPTASDLSGKVEKSGDTMTGPLNISSSSASADLSVTQSGAGPAATFMGGNVGIGTTSPGTKLDVLIAQSANNNFTNGFNLSLTDSGNKTTGASSNESAQKISASYSGNFTSPGTAWSLNGINSDITYSGTINSSGYGNDLYLNAIYANAVNSGTVPGSDGSVVAGVNANASGTASNSVYYGVLATAQGAGHQSAGLAITSVDGSTTNMGILIQSPSASSSNYAIYSQSPAKSYFAGNVGIGLTSPTYALDVSGDVNVTGNFRVNGSIVGASQWLTSGSHIYYNSGNVGIGTSNPNFKLELAGASSNDGTIGVRGQRAFYLPDQTTFTGSLFLGDGGAYLTNSGGTDGQANTGAGLGALLLNESGHDNAALGTGALYSNTSGSQNTAVGSGALYLTSSTSDNTAIGYAALKDNTSGNDNVAVGSWAMNKTDSGYGNAAVGSNVMFNNIDGGANTAVGQEALSSNRSKSDSTAIGYLSMKYADDTSSWVSSYNTAIGAFSLRGSTTAANNTGIRNTALGHSALMGMTSGSGNIGIGYNSGSSITTGSNNIIIGSNTGSTIATSSNNILIADGAGNERIRVNSSGQVGMGLTNPSYSLDVSGDVNVTGNFKVNGVNISTGSGTVNSGTINKMAFYSATGTAVSSNANVTMSNGVMTLGQSGSVIGGLDLAGSTSGTVSINPQATAGTYNFNLPTTAGTSGQVLTSGGGAGAPMTWLTLANSASVDTTNATNITSGTLSAGRLPAFTGDITTSAGSSATTIANDAVTSAKILDGTIVSADISAGAITFDKLNQSSASAGQVIKWSGSAWIASSDNGTSGLTSTDITSALTYTPVNKAGDTMTGALNLPSNGFTVGTSELAVSGGFVGVGTASPSAPLSVLNNQGLVKFETGQLVGLGPSQAYVPTMSFSSTLQSGPTGWDGSTKFTYNNTGFLIQHNGSSGPLAGPQGLGFSTGGRSTGDLFIDSTGRVGIGVGAPSYSVDISGDVNVTGNFKVNGTNISSGSVLTPAGGSAAAPGYAFSGDSNTGLFSSTADTLGFSTAGTERMTVTSDGKVGVGVDNPFFDFEVARSGTTASLSVTAAGYDAVAGNTQFVANHYMGASNSGHPRVSFNNRRGVGGAPTPIMSGDTLGAFEAWGGTDTAYTVRQGALLLFMADGNYTNTSAPGAMSFRTTPPASTTPVERMRIDSAGNVGIGTTSNAGSKLDVIGNVRFLASDTDAEGVKIHTSYSGNETSSRVLLAERQDDAYGWSLATAGLANPTLGGTTLTGLPAGTFNIVRHDGSAIGASALSINRTTGNVGIGNTAPRATLDVTGAIVSRASQSFAAGTIDFSVSNLRHTTQNCGSFALHNLKDGGTYMFAVQGTTVATCSFTAFSDAGTTPLTVHMPPDHGATTSGKHTIYNIAVMGTHAYIAWTPGY